MPTYTLIIMLLGNMSGMSGGVTSVPGYSSLQSCRAQADHVMQVQVDRGGRRVTAFCVEVK